MSLLDLDRLADSAHQPSELWKTVYQNAVDIVKLIENRSLWHELSMGDYETLNTAFLTIEEYEKRFGKGGGWNANI